MREVKEAVILAGGFGTRLRSIVRDVPKPMAEVSGRPFLHYVLGHLKDNGVRRAILSVGYRSEVIEDFLGANYRGVEIKYSIEENPLGTGGAVKKALKSAASNEIFILNGDSLFLLNLKSFVSFHHEMMSPLSIAVKRMEDTGRYGTLSLEGNRIAEFREKRSGGAGFINSGVYLLDLRRAGILDVKEDRFSFEEDYLTKEAKGAFAYVSGDFFIDIGVPEDYMRAQKELVHYFNGGVNDNLTHTAQNLVLRRRH